MTLNTASFDDMLRDLETCGDWGNLIIDLTIHRIGKVSRFYHAHDNWPMEDCPYLDNIISHLSDLAEDHARCHTFLCPEDEVTDFADQMLQGWKRIAPGGVYVSCRIEGSLGNNHWLAAMFADDKHGKDAAMLFKLALNHD